MGGGCGGGKMLCKGWCRFIPGAVAGGSPLGSSSSSARRAAIAPTGRSGPNCGCAESTMCASQWARSNGSSGTSASPAAADPEAGPAADEAVRKSRAGRKRPGRHEVREDRGRWAFQYTALDDCTRFRVLRLYRRHHQSSSLSFLAELCRALPFRIRKLQCDNGHEFPFAFALAVQALGIRHRYIKPRCPQQNGKVERSHRIDQEEFWGRHRFADFDSAVVGLRAWETRYNHERFSLALQGRTPAEKLATLLPAPAAWHPCPKSPQRTAGPGSILTRPNKVWPAA